MRDSVTDQSECIHEQIASQHAKNMRMAAALQQKIYRLRIVCSPDCLSPLFPSGSKEEFLNTSRVQHEKLRRSITSTECAIESVRAQICKRIDERDEKLIQLKDLKEEIESKFSELQSKKLVCTENRIRYDQVFKTLVSTQEKFSGIDTFFGSSLDGMRRNINRLLKENKDLVKQQQFMSKQSRLFEFKLRATRAEVDKSKMALFDRSTVGTSSIVPSSLCRSGELLENEFEENFLRESLMNVNGGSTACNMYNKMIQSSSPLSSAAMIAQTKSRIMHLLGREFFANWKYAQTLFSLSEALQYMATLRNIDKAVQFVISAICRLCECDRASYWVIDRLKGIAWTKVPVFSSPPTVVGEQQTEKHPAEDDEEDDWMMGQAKSNGVDPIGGSGLKESGMAAKNMTTLMIPVNTGLVGASFKTGQIINISDAYADPRFNRTVDLKTEYRTRSVLCYPIVYHDQIVGVCQCINKLSPNSSVFSNDDIETVKTLGSAMLNVLESCHSHEESKKLAIRRGMLVEAVDEIMRKMKNRKELLQIIKQKMRRIFKANEANIVLVYRDFYAKIVIDFDGTLSLIDSDRTETSGGLIHECASRVEPVHLFGRSVLSAWQHRLAKVDADILKNGCLDSQRPTAIQEGDVSVHCYPFMSSSRLAEVSAVFQWVCLDRSVIGFGDDGSFNEKNQVHLDLIRRFVNIVSFHIERFWPSKYRLQWTKAKHLQLKVRGMISFSKAARIEKRDNAIRHFAPPTNRKVVGLWKRAKVWALEFGKFESNLQPVAAVPSHEIARRRTVATENFLQKLNQERESMSKRKTIVIDATAIHALATLQQPLPETISEESSDEESVQDISEREPLSPSESLSDSSSIASRESSNYS